MARLPALAMTLLADLFYSVSVVLMVICLAVGNAKPTSNFSWTKFSLDVTQTNGKTYEYEWNLGLHEFVICFSPDDFPCQTYSLNNNDMFNDQATVASHCYTAGSGVIAAGTFAMLFALLAMAALHTYTTFKRVCGCACPVPRLFVALFSLLSLGLYIGVVTIWWIKCENNISDLAWVTDVRGGGTGRQNPSGLKPGYALIVAILCTVFVLLGWVFATLRSFVAHGDDDGNTTGKSYGGSSGSTSPAHGNGPYGQQVYSPSTEGQYNGGSKQDTYGY